jgi:hypothetical protein
LPTVFLILEARQRFFQNPSLLEGIARPIPGIQYGNSLQVLLKPDEIPVFNHWDTEKLRN